MAGTLSLVAGVPLRDNPVAQPLYLKQPHPQYSKPTRITVTIDWSKYGAPTTQQIGVAVNLVAGNNQQQNIDSIRSVYIDNSFSNVPIYVYFPDSGFVAVAAPNTVSVQTVMTSVPQALIYSEGFEDVPPVTTVIFTNAELQPYSVSTLFTLQSVLTFIGTVVSTSGPASPAVFTNVPVGPAALQRLTIFACMFYPAIGTVLPSQVSVNGGTPFDPLIKTTLAASGQNGQMMMGTYNLPSVSSFGSMSFSWTGGGAITNPVLSIYSLTRYQAAAPVDNDIAQNAANSALTVTSSMPKGSIGVYGAVTEGSGAAITLTNAVIDNTAAAGSAFWGVGHARAAIDQSLTVGNAGVGLGGLIWL